MITELSNRSRYVKFGVSENPLRRVKEVQTGSPLKIEWLLEMCVGNDIGSYHHARIIETELHKEHADCHSNGEWFKFNEGTKAKAQAYEALKLIGEKLLGTALIFTHEVSQTRKLTFVGDRPIPKKYPKYEPTVGNQDVSMVAVTVNRRKSLIKNA